jgi:hypothetical protein
MRILTTTLLAVLVGAGCSDDSTMGPDGNSQGGGAGGGSGSDPGAPEAPSGLQVLATCNALTLTWMDNSSREDGFRIYRQEVGAEDSLQLLATLGPNMQSFADGTVVTERAYLYAVRSFNASGESAGSNVVSATAVDVPTSPSNLTIASINGNQLTLYWTDLSSNESGFDVRGSWRNCRTSAWSGWQVMASTGPNTSQATVSIVIGTYDLREYVFQVSARNACGSSGLSNAVRTWCL